MSPFGLDLVSCSNWSLLLRLQLVLPAGPMRRGGGACAERLPGSPELATPASPSAAGPWRAPLRWVAAPVTNCLAVEDFHDAHTSFAFKKP